MMNKHNEIVFSEIQSIIDQLDTKTILDDRKAVLKTLIDYVQSKVNQQEPVRLNFICTHNSRRSHLSQIWAQVAAEYFNIQGVHCYSGGTEETALFPKVAETLINQGFHILRIEESANPVYAIKYNDNALPIIGFSKKYDSAFNPSSNFAAIMTCSQADSGCPFIGGAEKRIPITFEDPKVADNTPEQTQVYEERSLQIATEMFYVFSQINK
jgi:arsenate reductase